MTNDTAPKTSPRPKSKPTELELMKRKIKENDLIGVSQEFGDVEFEMDLAKTWEEDLTARIGYRVARVDVPPNPDPNKFRADTITRDRMSLVSVTANVAAPAVWNHEFRHVGMKRIKDKFSREEVAEKYGDFAASTIFDREEAAVELFDDPEAAAAALGTMRRTIQSINPDADLENSYYAKVSQAMSDMALDILKDDGVTPAERKQAVGWFGNLMNNIFGDN